MPAGDGGDGVRLQGDGLLWTVGVIRIQRTGAEQDVGYSPLVSDDEGSAAHPGYGIGSADLEFFRAATGTVFEINDGLHFATGELDFTRVRALS